MKKFAAFIVKYRRAMLMLFVVLLILSIVGVVMIVVDGKLNSDLMSYISDDMNTAIGLDFLEETFNIKGDMMLVVSGDGSEEDEKLLRETINSVRGKDGVSQLIWVGDMQDAEKALDGIRDLLKGGDGSLGDKILSDSVKAFLEKVITDLDIPITVDDIKNLGYDFSDAIAYLKQPDTDNEGGYNYVLLGMLDYAPSTDEAMDLLTETKELFASQGRIVESTGMTSIANDLFTGILSELPYYVVFAVIAVILILVVTTDSFLDPIILIVTLGVSIVISLGSCWFFDDLSIVSFALSSVLQLAVTMDYAIFFLHVYKQKRAEGLSSRDAVIEAAPNVWSSVIASCLTTAGGFAALYFMRFTLGADIGRVLIKAVLISLVSVVVLQPVLMIISDKASAKCTHPSLSFGFPRLSDFVVKHRKALVTIAVIILIPAFILQNLIDYSYFKVFDDPEQPTSQQVLTSELYNQLMCAVPIVPKEGDVDDFVYDAEEVLGDDLRLQLSIFAILDIDENTLLELAPKIESLLENTDAFKELIPDGVDMNKMMASLGLPSDFSSEGLTSSLGNFIGKSYKEDGSVEYYTMFTFIIGGADESEHSLGIYKDLTEVIDSYYDDAYSMGMLTGVDDMKTTTPGDFLKVTLASVAIILAVMLLLLRNVRQSVLTVLLIELGIFVNLAISVLIGETINFMAYILLSSIQLGCTVDYAILLCTRYREYYIKYLGDRKSAVTEACRKSFFSVLTSCSIIVSVCLIVAIVSANNIVRQITLLLARGGFISFVLVVFVLPGILYYTRPTVFGSRGRRIKEAVAERKASESEPAHTVKKKSEEPEINIRKL